MNLKQLFLMVSISGILLAACAPALEAGAADPSPVEENNPPQADSPTAADVVEEVSSPPASVPQQAPPGGAEREFSTDFNKTIISYDDVLSGGPPKDGIPAIDQPAFVSVEEADDWLADVEPVILVEAGGAAKAYPIQILVWHEIVNDSVGGVPLSITFCPLCNTAIAFERTLDGQVLDFGTTGRLRYSNLIMYDRQTETWWQQASGQAIAGELTGRHGLRSGYRCHCPGT